MKYSANFNVNNGTSYSRPIESNNLRKIKSRIASVACESIFRQPTNEGHFWIYDRNGKKIVHGLVFISKNLKPYVRYYE